MTWTILKALVVRDVRPLLRDGNAFWSIASAGAVLSITPLFVTSGLTDVVHVLVLVYVWGAFPVMSASAIQRDLDEGTFESLYATPLAPLHLLVAKAIVLLVWMVFSGLALLPVLMVLHNHFDVPWERMEETLLLSAAVAVCGVGLGLLVGCGVRRSLLVPFALYGAVIAVLLLPALGFSVLGLWAGIDLAIFQAAPSPLWALFHPWLGMPGTFWAFVYLAYLLFVGGVSLIAAGHTFTRRIRRTAGPHVEEASRGWQPIRDDANPVSAAYFRTNPFSAPDMQRVLFATGALAGTFFQIRLLPNWPFLSMGHSFDADYFLFALVTAGILVVSQETVMRRANRDQLRATLISAKSADRGVVWGALRLTAPLLLGLILGRTVLYFGYVIPFAQGPPDLPVVVFLIETVTYFPVAVCLVLGAMQSTPYPTNNHAQLSGKVLSAVMSCYAVEMIGSLFGRTGAGATGGSLIRLGVYLAYIGFYYWMALGRFRDSDPWKPLKDQWGRNMDE